MVPKIHSITLAVTDRKIDKNVHLFVLCETLSVDTAMSVAHRTAVACTFHGKFDEAQSLLQEAPTKVAMWEL